MTLIILFLTGLLAGTVDAISGGGGLISLPVLLSLGVPPHLAFGTNKLQGTIGTFVAARKYHQHGYITKGSIYYGVFFGLMGAISGSVTGQILSSDVLRKIIPVLLCMVLAYTLFTPRLGIKDEKPKMNAQVFYLVFGFGLGFYDGFFGPGTGSFWVCALIYFLGYNLIKATAYTKVFNFNSSLIASICFALGGNIDYRFALCMAVGSLLGGKLGAHLAITKGARLIRPIFLGMVALTIAVMVYKTYSQSEFFMRITQQYGILPSLLIGLVLMISMIVIYYKRTRKEMSL